MARYPDILDNRDNVYLIAHLYCKLSNNTYTK